MVARFGAIVWWTWIAVIGAAVVVASPIQAANYSAGDNIATPIVGTETLNIDFGPPDTATQSGDISGDAGDVLTVTSTLGGTLNLRGDNSGFLGTVVFQGGVLNVDNANGLIGSMARLSFAGTAGAASTPTLQIADGAAVVIDGAGGATQRLQVAEGASGAIEAGTGSTLTWRGSVASNGGAVILSSGSEFALTASDPGGVVFTGNRGTGDGGALFSQSATLTLDNARFESNSAGRYGGALHLATVRSGPAVATVDNTVFTGNTALYDGGAVSVSASTPSVSNQFTGTNLTFTGNQSTGGSGGALYNGFSEVTITGSDFTGNRAYLDGGAIRNNNILDVSDTTFSGNASRRSGGAVYSYRTSTATGVQMDFTRVDFTGNTAGQSGSSGRGGAIYAQNTTLNLEDVNFTNNTATWNGGAIFQWEGVTNLSVTDGFTSTFSGNRDQAGSSAIYISTSAAAALNIDVADGGVLDMQDALSGAAGGFGRPGNITIIKDGDGLWNLGGSGVFTSAAGGATTVDINAGTLHLYGQNEAGSAANGGLQLAGAGSRFTLGSGATLSTGGDNTLTAGGGVFFNDGSAVVGGNGPNNSTKLNFSPATLGGNVTFSAAADQTLVLNGVFTGGTGTLVKEDDGQILFTQTGSVIESLQVNNGSIGFVVGTAPAAPNLTVDSVTLAPGTTVNVSGFNGGQLGERVVLVQSTDDIVGDVSSYEVGGEVGGVDYLAAMVEKTVDQKQIVAEVGLTWYAQPADAHGTFTLTTARSAFELGTVLEDRTDGPFPTNNWDGRSLTKAGLGTLVLTGANTYTGDTTIEDGILSITNLQGTGVNQANTAVVIDAPGTLQLNIAAAQSGEYRKTITGDGGLVKMGDGRVVLTADNSGFSGDVAVDGGTLVATGADSLGSGDVEVTGELALAYNGVFANTVSGTGVLTTTGDLTLTGDHTAHTGLTDVAAGTLRVDAPFTSGATFAVLSGATLAGDGTVGNLVARSGGAVRPGDGYETLRVTGDATFHTGSIYQVAVDSFGTAANEIAVGGTVTIENGARLAIRQGGNGRMMQAGQQSFRIIGSTLFTDGTLFDVGPTSRIGFDLFQEIRADGLYLTSTFHRPDFSGLVDGVGTPNAIRAGQALDALVGSGEAGNLGDLYDALINLEADPWVAAGALAQLHGEVFASAQTAVTGMQDSFIRQARHSRDVASRLCSPEGPNRDATLWVGFTASWLDRDTIGRGYSGYDLDSTGVALGMDRSFGPAFVGLAFGYDHAKQDFDTIRSRAEFDAFRTLLYAGWRDGPWMVDAHLGFSKTWTETRRHIAIGEVPNRFAARADAKYNDNLLSAGAELRRVFAFCPVTVTPSIGIEYTYLRSPAVREHGAGPADLAVDKRRHHSLRLPIGVSAGWEYAGDGFTLRPEARITYVPELGRAETRADTRFQAAPSASFRALSGHLGRHAGRFGVGIQAVIRDQVRLRFDYDCSVGKKSAAHVLSLAAALEW